MNNQESHPNQKYLQLLIPSIIVLGIILCIFMGFQKKGFYIDEFYTYTRANGTGIGIAVDVGEWNSSAKFVSELVSEGSENFNFSQTYENCGFHPVVYHYMLHLISSFFPGVFSKWLGIGLNIFIYAVMLILLADILWNVSLKDIRITAIGLACAAFSPCVISGVMFVRMYMALALFAVWYADLHVHDLKRDRLSVTRFLIPVCICGFLGFLTMYYFVIYMFFVTFFYCFYLFFCCKRYRDTIIYGLTATLSLVLSYFYMPECIYYIFKAKNGKSRKVASNLISTEGIGKRIVYFYKLLNKHVAGGLLPVFIVALIIGTVVLLLCIRRSGSIRKLSYQGKCLIILAAPALLYFLLMVKMSVKEVSNSTHRYNYIIYPLFVMLMALGLFLVLRRYGKIFRHPYVITGAIMSLVILLAYAGNQVLYLYPSLADENRCLTQYQDLPVVVLERDDGQIDALINELLLFDESYFAVIDKPETAEDEIIAGSDELLVFVDKNGDEAAALDLVLNQNDKLTKADLLCKAGTSFNAYLLH